MIHKQKKTCQLKRVESSEKDRSMMLSVTLWTAWEGARCIADLADILHKSLTAAKVICMQEQFVLFYCTHSENGPFPII